MNPNHLLRGNGTQVNNTGFGKLAEGNFKENQNS